MVQLAVTLQDEVLDTLKLQRPNDYQLHEDLELIRKTVPKNESPEDKEKRVRAEQRVKCVVLDHGERIGHHGCISSLIRISTAVKSNRDLWD